MENITCECTDKSVKNLENAIKLLLNRGKEVNRILEDEKMQIQRKKKEEIAAIKGEAPPPTSETNDKDTITCSPQPPVPMKLPTTKSRRTLYNKRTKASENIDFDIPSLKEEKSEKKRKSSERTPSTLTSTSLSETMRSIQIRGSNCITLSDTYTVDINGKPEKWPSKIILAQLGDGSFDISYHFMDLNGRIIMNMNLNMNGDNISNINIDGKKFRQLGSNE